MEMKVFRFFNEKKMAITHDYTHTDSHTSMPIHTYTLKYLCKCIFTYIDICLYVYVS